jgi:DNA-binding transcriptional MocR family regulator
VRLLGTANDVLARRQRQISERLQLVTTLLRTKCPDWTWSPPRGGLSIWVELPRGCSSSELAEAARHHGAAVSSGRVTSPGGKFDDHLRIPLGEDPPVLAEGIDRLAKAWYQQAHVSRMSDDDVTTLARVG